MKMRRIKLFEAFSNTDKIGKANHFLLCWSVKEFIEYEKLESKLFRNYFKLYRGSERVMVNRDGYGTYFSYNFENGDFMIYCDLKPYIEDKEITTPRNWTLINPLREAAREVIKKMYQKQKNKAL